MLAASSSFHDSRRSAEQDRERGKKLRLCRRVPKITQNGRRRSSEKQRHAATNRDVVLPVGAPSAYPIMPDKGKTEK